jgi:RNA polymerase sigma factor (sigma-70 family)
MTARSEARGATRLLMERPVLNEVAGEVLRLRAGDPVAEDQLARRACRLALRTAAAILHTREEAADVAQDVGVDVLRSLHKLRDPAAFDAWVHRITVRHALKALRRRRAARLAETPRGQMPDEPVEAGRFDRAELLAARAALVAALGRLPPRQRLALALRYVHDLSEREVAAALGCRLGTAQSLLSRGRARLRRDPRLLELAPTTTPGAAE